MSLQCWHNGATVGQFSTTLNKPLHWLSLMAYVPTVDVHLLLEVRWRLGIDHTPLLIIRHQQVQLRKREFCTWASSLGKGAYQARFLLMMPGFTRSLLSFPGANLLEHRHRWDFLGLSVPLHTDSQDTDKEGEQLMYVKQKEKCNLSRSHRQKRWFIL